MQESRESIPIALVEASNQLYSMGIPLTKTPKPVSSLPSMSRVQGRAGAFGEMTRTHRSIAVSDSGEGFAMGRISSEVYPIPGPLCDMRSTYDVFGQPSRYVGREPAVYEK